MSKAIRFFVVMLMLTGVIYPLAVTVIAKWTFPDKANGSLLYRDDHVVGSLLIAQKTVGEGYFHPRPSAIDYVATNSGSSNLGPTSRKLQEQVKMRRNELGPEAPAELLYSSGSGLDPHITVDAALFQSRRISGYREIPVTNLENLIYSHQHYLPHNTVQAYVNVLELNLELDKVYGRR